jgi:transcriptional regulator with XRE-family HTH domain
MRGGNGDAAGSPRVVFGRVVRHCREQAGLSQEQLGGLVYLTGDMVAKIERGKRTASEKFVIDCEALPELPTNGTLRVLWEQLRESFTGRSFPGWFADWASKEGEAVKFRWFELALIPGLLQTEEYATALLRDRIGFNGDVDEVVAARMARQAILSRDDPPELFVIIDENVLHRPVGGPEVMAAQLKQITQPASRTILRVIPEGTGVHDGLQGAFTVADFADGTSAAYLESGLRGMVIQDSDDVAALAATWDRLAAEALPRSASLKLIEEVADKWNQS